MIDWNSTKEYQNSGPLRQRFLRNKQHKQLIEHGLTICKNRGWEYYEKNYCVTTPVRNIVRELFERV